MHRDVKQMIAEAVRVLKRGGVIAYPTETTYGLGCDPRNVKAIERIYRMKGREKKKPLLLVAASEAQVRSVVGAGLKPAPTKALIRKYWPGPLTLVLPIVRAHGYAPSDRKAHIRAPLSKSIAPHGEVAIRVSSSPIVQELCRAFGFPIVSTSANRSGEPECRSGRAVRRSFASRQGQPDFILDSGSLPRRKLSTVARVSSSGAVEILRHGAVHLGVA